MATRNQDNRKHGGRPTVADGKRLSKAVTVKFFDKRSDFVGYSKKDYELLKVRSKKANKRMVEYVRESALQSEVVQPHTEAELKEFRTLVGLANRSNSVRLQGKNLNQLTKMAHQDGIIYLYSPIIDLLGEITNVVRTYKQDTNKKKR